MNKILIVDDEKELRETSAELLRLEGYEVVTAADGDEALSKGTKFNFDLALVDLVLPGKMNGLDIISKLRSHTASAHIIAFTGFSGQNFSQKAIKAGANEFVTKPGLAKNLVKNINKFFNKESAIVNLDDDSVVVKKPEFRRPVEEMSDTYSTTPGPILMKQPAIKSIPPIPESKPHNGFEFKPIILANMPDNNIKDILSLGKTITVNSGDNHIMDATSELVIIKSGYLGCWYRNSLVGYFKIGDAIGESSVFLAGQTNFMLLLKSEEDFELLVIDKKDLTRYLQDNKALAMRFAANTILSISKKFMIASERIARMNQEVRQLKTPVDGILY